MPTDIEWTHIPGYIGESWNLIAGCTKISPGCANCYAETIGLRFHRTGPFLPGYPIQLLPERLIIPFAWKKPRAVFVNSTSDTFHEDVPDSFLVKIYAIMALTPHHIYQLLTKRPDRVPGLRNLGWDWGEVVKTTADAMRRMNPVKLPEYDGTWPLPNVWLGTSAENQYWANDRIPKILQCSAVIHYASLEPLLGPIVLHELKQPSGDVIDGLLGWRTARTFEKVNGLDQVIVGGESGHLKKIRPMHPEWVCDLRDQTKIAGKAFFFKQWGKYRPMTEYEVKSQPHDAKIVSLDPHERKFTRMLEETDAWMIKGSKGGNGNELDGRTWQEFPYIGNERIAP